MDEDEEKLSASETLDLAYSARKSIAITRYLWPKLERRAAYLESEVLGSEKMTSDEREKKRIKAKTLREVLGTIDADIITLEQMLKKRGIESEDASS